MRRASSKRSRSKASWAWAEALGEHRGPLAVPGVGADARRRLRCDAAGPADAVRRCRPTRRPFRLGPDRALVDPLVERARLDLGLLGRRITRRPRCTGRPDLGRPLLGGGQRASGTLLVTAAGTARAGPRRTVGHRSRCHGDGHRRRDPCWTGDVPRPGVAAACGPGPSPDHVAPRDVPLVRRRRHHDARRPGSAVGRGSRSALATRRTRRATRGHVRRCYGPTGAPRKTTRGRLPIGAPSPCEIRRRPTLPGGLPPSTIGAGSLNFRVRDGNGCDPAAMATEICCQGVARCAPSEHSRASTSIRFQIQALGRLVPVG